VAKLEAGSIFAGFQIESELGAGGMGVVYRATQLALDRTVALKLITPDFASDEDFRERFKRESRLAASIEHPNVVTVYEAGEENGQLYIAMRYIAGTDLLALIRAEDGLEPARAAHLLTQVAAALDAAHARGLVHRDVKPANVLVADGDHAYLTDFGLTKSAASVGPTKTGQWVGTADYVAPEQIMGEPVDARADVYALGCVLYHALTGKPPFVRDSEIAKIWAHVNDPPPALRESAATPPPPAFDGVIRRAMAKAPGDRYPSAGDLGRAATAALEGRAISEPERSIASGAAAPVTGTRPSAELPEPGSAAGAARNGARPRRARIAVAAAVLVLIAAAGLLATGAFQSDDDGNDAPAGEEAAVTGSEPAPREVESLVQAFADIYGAEDPDALAGLLAPDFQQRQGSDVRDRDDTVKAYRREIRRLDALQLSLELGPVETERGRASVSGRYLRTAENEPPEGGSITFGVVKVGATLLIDEITLDPS
jgi:hypothetical protein